MVCPLITYRGLNFGGLLRELGFKDALDGCGAGPDDRGGTSEGWVP